MEYENIKKSENFFEKLTKNCKFCRERETKFLFGIFVRNDLWFMISIIWFETFKIDKKKKMILKINIGRRGNIFITVTNFWKFFVAF